MKYKMMLTIGIVAFAVGCVPYSMKRTPELPKKRNLPAVENPPAIRLVVNDMTGGPVRVATAVDHAKKKMPYLSTISNDVRDPDYTIQLLLSYTEEESNVVLSAYSLGLIPNWGWQEVSVRATVKDSEEKMLGVFESRQKNKHFMQLHMIYILPVTAPVGYSMDRKMWNATVRDALFQAGQAIAEDRGFDTTASLIAGRSSGGE